VGAHADSPLHGRRKKEKDQCLEVLAANETLFLKVRLEGVGSDLETLFLKVRLEGVGSDPVLRLHQVEQRSSPNPEGLDRC